MATHIKPEDRALKKVPAKVQSNWKPKTFGINVWQSKKDPGKEDIPKADPGEIVIKNVLQRKHYR